MEREAVARPNWEFIRVDVLMPDHPKIEELSDKAFRALITLWCYCGLHRNDGIVTAKRWREVPARVRAELVDHGLAKPMELGGAVMHDFVGDDGHQRSRDEIDELAERRKDIATKAANARWAKERPPLCVKHMHQACVTHARSMLRAYARVMPRQWQWQWQFKSRWYRWL